MHRRIDNIIAQLMDLNKELENQYDILEALCSDYLAIYKVDFDTGTFGVHRVDRQLRPESVQKFRKISTIMMRQCKFMCRNL